eukprot:3495142-Pleurochrysis_carterae.AAC.1
MRSSRADWEREGTPRTVSILKAGKSEPPVRWVHAMRGRRFRLNTSKGACSVRVRTWVGLLFGLAAARKRTSR